MSTHPHVADAHAAQGAQRVSLPVVARVVAVLTAVGATRFVGQTVGHAEMATDQFGSGGGFSAQFDQVRVGGEARAARR
eukprot:7356139-Prymnesium_polylepis.1